MVPTCVFVVLLYNSQLPACTASDSCKMDLGQAEEMPVQGRLQAAGTSTDCWVDGASKLPG